MRILMIALLALLVVAPAFAQAPASGPSPYGLDPYKPSDAMWLRTYGAALVAQTPLLDLATLDPYKPSEAALIRQVGGAMPLCCPDAFWPVPVLGPSWSHAPRHVSAVRLGAPPAGFHAVAAAPVAQAPMGVLPREAAVTPTSVATVARPQTNNGVTVRFDGRMWSSAGRALALDAGSFERIGEASGFPVYRVTGASDGLIYVATGRDLVAPYRQRP